MIRSIKLACGKAQDERGLKVSSEKVSQAHTKYNKEAARTMKPINNAVNAQDKTGFNSQESGAGEKDG